MSDQEYLFCQLIQYHNNLKLFHFQTKSYSAHKASDGLYNDLIGLIDQLFETLQGKVGRLNLSNTPVYLDKLTTEELIKYTETTISNLRKDTKNLKETAIRNILDEIVAKLYQFIYLLSFE